MAGGLRVVPPPKADASPDGQHDEIYELIAALRAPGPLRAQPAVQRLLQRQGRRTRRSGHLRLVTGDDAA